eukprot:TRINITY_DN3542_c0_g1_i1.p1 TRINITY_DN3542_c0_g1~~TRINITY_DN3542_c0_g1_i1.p1  ORF type:complete len:246 (+),score=51.35 TRINITY_DN3542_c0_g1_i1:163-900(+)
MNACPAQLKKLVVYCLMQAIVQGIRNDKGFEAGDKTELSVAYNLTDPCRVDASKVYTRYYDAAQTASHAKSFCDGGGDASCMIEQYNYHNKVSTNQQSVHVAAEVCKHGGDSCMSNAAKVYAKFYNMDKITDNAQKFCEAGGDGHCIIDTFNDFNLLITKQRIKAAACVCQKDHNDQAARRNALKVYTRHYDVSDSMFRTDACDMMEKFLNGGGDADCLVEQYNQHTRVETTQNAITIAAGACSR